MLKNAKESVYCRTSVKYLDYIEKIAKKDIQIYLVVLADGNEVNMRFKRLSRMSNVDIKIIDKIEMLTHIEMDKKEEKLMKRSIENIKEYMDLDNQFLLVVDDSEFLAVPPLKSDSLTAISSTNKALIFNSKIDIEKSLYSV